MLAVLLTSVFFVLIGFVGVARVKTFNQYIIVIPVFLIPTAIPLLNFLEITNTYWFYMIPSQASLLLFEAGFSTMATWKIVYAIVYLSASIFGAYVWAKKSYQKHIK